MLVALAAAAAVATLPPVIVEGRRSPLSDPQVVRGRELARRRCVGCHSAQPSGASLLPSAPPFRGMPSLNPLVLQRVALEVGRYDHAGMPSIVLSKGEAEAIAAYIRAFATADPDDRKTLSVTACFSRIC